MRALLVVVTGSECTGKTTLAARLAERFGCGWVPEFSREYAEAKGEPLDASDVEPIARGQLGGQAAAAVGAGELLVLDTDLLSTVVYARHYYGSCPSWVEEAARGSRGDLYLLCHPDLPWLPDGVRDRGGSRAELHSLFEEELRSAGVAVVDVRGGWGLREPAAAAAVEELLASRATVGTPEAEDAPGD